MVMSSLAELVSRHDFMRTRRSNHEPVWQDISDLMMPWRGDITTKRSPGQKRVTGVWDSTATILSEQFSSFLKGSVIPSGSDFIRLEVDGTEGDIEVRQLLDRIGLRVLRAYSRSNFYPQAATHLRDFSILGNGLMSVSPKPGLKYPGAPRWNGMLYEAVPIRRVWWWVGATGEVDIIVREIEMTATDATKFFDNMPGNAALLARSTGSRMATLPYLHFVYRNEEGIPGGLTAPEDKPWISQWVLRVGSDAEIVREGGFERCPYVPSRWMVVDGDEYASGRGHIARVDAKGLNELRRQILIATGRDLLPPLVVEKESVAEFDVSYDGVMISKPSMRNQPFHLRSEANYAAADQIARLDRAQISSAFYGDALSESETQPRSAEESRLRQTRAIQRMAAPAEVVDKDFLGPVTEATIEALYEAGQLPEMDELAQIIGGQEIDIRFVSPFFTAQKASKLQAVDQFLARRLALFSGTNGDPVWVRDINPEGVTRLERQLADLPGDIFHTEEEIEAKKEIESQQEAIERAMSIQAALAGGSPARAAVPAAAPAARPGGELAAEPIGV